MMAKPGMVLPALIVLAGVVIFEFAPGGFLFQPVKMAPGAMLSPHGWSHVVGGVLAMVIGAAVLAMRKKLGGPSAAIGAVTLIIGLVFALDAKGLPLYDPLVKAIPHGTGMQALGALTIVVGLIGLVVLGKGAKVSA